MSSDRPSLERTLAQLHLARGLKPFFRARKFILVVTLPPNSDIGEWMRAVNDCMPTEFTAEDWHHDVNPHTERRVELVTKDIDGTLGLDGVSVGRISTVVLVHDIQKDTFLAHPSIAAADAVIDIPELSAAYMQRAVLTACDRKITFEEAKALVGMSSKRRKLISRAGRNMMAVISSLDRAEKRTVTVVEKPKVTDGPHLEGMHGYGEAQTWGLELARDIADYKAGRIDWNDVDSGLLLSGPPGCGKTTFAAALARTCDMAFVVGSYASWQSTGHQGDMLKAMRAAFSEARRKAPSVFLIDEIDGFISREGNADSHNSDYLRGVVNGLLEELDGSTGREGVVVIGACNNASIVDPALCRPGRLDRHIAIELPDDEARMVILKGYLQSDHDLDMRLFRTKTVGMSGADLERLARDARRLARREGITVEYRHVNACLPRRELRSEEQLYRIALHEIGHAVIGALVGAPLDHVFINPDYIPNSGGQIAGGAAFRPEDGRHQDRQYFADRICVALGAMACEQMLLDSHGDGVIMDLTEATTTATFALVSVGMGDTLSSGGHREPEELARMRAYDPVLSRRVEELLQEQLARARAMLEERREVVEHLIFELFQRKRLLGGFIYSRLEIEQPAQNFG